MSVLQLFRLFLPSWRFFEEAGQFPVLKIRIFSKEKWGEWQIWKPTCKRNFSHLFLNSKNNLFLLYLSLIEQLVQECNETSTNTEKIVNSVPYLCVSQLVQEHIQGLKLNASKFQFKLGTEDGDALVSMEHPFNGL